jgi:hypothetical protein
MTPRALERILHYMVQEIDLSFELPERGSMAEAKAALDELGCQWTQTGAWLRVHLPRSQDLFICPGSGSLRFEGGQIFSSKGLKEALKIIEVYR